MNVSGYENDVIGLTSYQDADDDVIVNAEDGSMTLVSTNNGSSSSSNETMSSGQPLFLLEQSWFLPLSNGYVSPALVFLTLVTNCLVCLVLMRRNMRNPTNILLVAIACSDMLTGIWPVPCLVYFYATDRYRDWVPHGWCFAYYCLAEYLPTIFHTASIWLTVALAGQRYICVCHALKAREICTIPNFVRVIILIYIAAVASHLSRFLEMEYIPVTVPSRLDPFQNVTTCRTELTPLIKAYTQVYFNFYFWFRVIFIHLVPCVSLVVLNGILIDAMKKAQARRQQLLKLNRRSESRHLAESNGTTLMLVQVVGVFLLVEFPLAILFIIIIVQNTFELAWIDRSTGQLATWSINLLILLSYPINFFIYCAMSRQFRQTFYLMFCRRYGTASTCELVTEISVAKPTAGPGNGGPGNGGNYLPMSGKLEKKRPEDAVAIATESCF